MTPLEIITGDIASETRRQPRLDTIRVIREKSQGDRTMVAIEFASDHGIRYRGVWGATVESGRWEPEGSSSSPVRPTPEGEMWANAGGWSAGRAFAFGGWTDDD